MFEPNVCIYAIVRYDGSVFMNPEGVRTHQLREANLVIIKRGDSLIRYKDRYSLRNGDELTLEQANRRVAQHVQAALLNVDVMER